MDLVELIGGGTARKCERNGLDYRAVGRIDLLQLNAGRQRRGLEIRSKEQRIVKNQDIGGRIEVLRIAVTGIE